MNTRYNSEYGRTIDVVSPTQQLAMSRFMTRTYGWMFFGLMLTGMVSYYIASNEALVQSILMNRGIFFGAVIAEFALVLGLTAGFKRLSATTATLGFLAYSLLNGVTFAAVFLIYTMSSIGMVFMITAGMFGGLALYGTVTKKDLTGVGSFVGMGLWGLILVMLVNMFVRSEALNLGLAVAGVIIFAGLTAYDAQRIKGLAYQATSGSRGDADKGAVFGALMLYLNFINLFWSLLRLFGDRRQ